MANMVGVAFMIGIATMQIPKFWLIMIAHTSASKLQAPTDESSVVHTNRPYTQISIVH